MTPAAPFRDDELVDLLDAYVDDELTEQERASVTDFLDRSPEARAELAAIDRVRSMVRSLPDVDAPFGFYEHLSRPASSAPRLRGRRRRAPGLVFACAGAVAAAIVLVVAIAPVSDRFAPSVDELNERHAMLASSTRTMPEGYTPIAADDVGAMSEPYALPPDAPKGYEQMAAYRMPDGLHFVYGNGESMVSVFEQEGHVEWAALPSGGSHVSMDGDQAWVMTMSLSGGATGLPATAVPETDVVVLAREGLVVTVIGGAPHDDVVALAEAVPDPPAPSVTDRMGNACAWVAQGFGFPD